MTRDQIIALQKRVGTAPDGHWGPKSIAACQAHLRKLMPSPVPWPATSQGALTQFYGPAGDQSRLTSINVETLGVAYFGAPVKTVRVNKACAASLLRILQALSKSHPRIIAQYAGVFDNRPMRGGSTPSLHARGAAIDLDPAGNGLNTHWPNAATMPIEVMETFACEGWLAAGAFWSRDAMHFQATL